MNRLLPKRFRAVGLVLCALAGMCVCTLSGAAQADQAQTTQLLGKAHALEVRGRMDMAKQTWQQVLLVDPNNSEALAGMARAAKLEGKNDEAAKYLNKMRAINPNDPNIARVETMGTAQDTSVQLQEAGRLAQAGQYARAMTILRQVYGATPPPGDAALSYYQTEAATEDGRPHAIAGLRELMDKYPQDSRYQITLGKILTYNPRTRQEGRKLLEKHPQDPEASEALRQSLLWDAQNPATTSDIRRYLSGHKDQQLSTALAQTDANQAAAKRAGRLAGPPLTPEQLAAQAADRERSTEVQAAYSALNAKRYPEAESRFQAIIAKNPHSAQAMAGLGYVRMSQSNFGGAISYLEQAEQEGSRDAGVDKALRDSRFFYTMQVATAALNENDLLTAQQKFTDATRMRPNDPSPLLGLGGTLLKAQQSGPAINVFTEYVRMAPNDKAAWRGLFMAQYGANQFAAALATDKRVPAGIHRDLMRDPDYLRTLASTYSALGRDADAQRTLRSALDLPFPADARGVRADLMLQYASLLVAANRPEQAAGLYRQVLAGDSTNMAAYQGLIEIAHTQGQDQQALQAIQQMPPNLYEQAMQEPGFQTTVASIYDITGHHDLAQQVLETYLANQQASGIAPSVAVEVQLAGIYMQHGDTDHAYPLYQSVLHAYPDRVDAWSGLLTALHSTGHDQEALAEIQQIPPETRRKLETDPAYLQTVGSIYSALNQPLVAMSFYQRVQQHYAALHLAPPAEIDVQEAWLLFNSGYDQALYRQLMTLGGRQDLTDQQRLTVQTIWANWAVRRATASIALGNYKRAIALLNAAAKAFPGNPAVLRALASGYAAAGLPKTAVEIYKSQDLSSGTVADYRAAVGAALSANDMKDAEVWLRFGLDQYPRDAQLLGQAAKFEEARGNAGRAADYYRASLKALPPDDPGLELSNELSHPVVVKRVATPLQAQSLEQLLAQPDPTTRGIYTPDQQVVVERPYLPSYTGAYENVPVPVVVPRPQTRENGYNNSLPQEQYTTQQQYVPQQTTMPQTYVIQQAPNGNPPLPPYNQQPVYTQQPLPGYNTQPMPQRSTTLKDYVPQSRMELPSVLHLHPSREMEAKYGPYVAYDPSEGMPRFAGAVLADGPASAGEGITANLHEAAFQQQSQTKITIPPSQPSNAGQGDQSQGLRPYPLPPPPAGQSGYPAQQQPASSVSQQPYTVPTPITSIPRPAQRTYSVPHVVEKHNPAGSKAASASKQANGTVAGQKSYPRIHLPPAPATTAAQNYDVPATVSGEQQSFPVPRTRSHTASSTIRMMSPPLRPVQPAQAPDGTPIVSYVPNAKPATHQTSAQSAAALRARAAAIRANQAEAPSAMTGESLPPAENFDVTPDVNPNAAVRNTQYSSQPFNPSEMQQTNIPSSSLPPTAPTSAQDAGQTTAPNTTLRSSRRQAQQQQNVPQQNIQPTPQQPSQEMIDQQYPQPNTRGTTTAPRRTTTRKAAPATPAPSAPVTYPLATPALTNQGYPQIGPTYPLGTAPSDLELQRRDVPPLRGYYDPRADEREDVPLTVRQQTELDLAQIEGSYSGWLGGNVIGAYRSGTPGVDRMASLEVPFEASAVLGNRVRFTAVPMAIFLNSGVLNTTAGTLGTSPVFGTVAGNSGLIYQQQFTTGFGGEGQMVTNTFAVAGGYSAYGFLVRNGIGRARWKPGNGHFTFFGGRDPVKETQLSYAGLRDPGQVSNPFAQGPIWGGVVQTGGGIRFDAGGERSGLYLQAEGYDLTGYHVQENRKYDGTMGAYFRVKVWPEYGSLNVGGAVFAEHYDFNERVESYGWGGYFSPNIYFLAAIPITYNGHYKKNLHYTINGSVGVQTFQEDSEPYYPLASDAARENELLANCGTATTVSTTSCGYIPSNSNTGLNYSIDAKAAYLVDQHWFIGAFLTGNNTNNYNTISGGFFARYVFRPQIPTEEYPTGMFPVEGFRPLRVP